MFWPVLVTKPALWGEKCPWGQGHFTGHRRGFIDGVQTGDIVIAVDYERGRAIGIVRIFRYDDADGDPGTVGAVLNETPIIEYLPPDDGACNPANGIPAGSIWVMNNDLDIDSDPWANFDRHADLVTCLPPSAFVEAAANLTVLGLGGDTCISSVNAKTRLLKSSGKSDSLIVQPVHVLCRHWRGGAEVCLAQVGGTRRSRGWALPISRDARKTLDT